MHFVWICHGDFGNGRAQRNCSSNCITSPHSSTNFGRYKQRRHNQHLRGQLSGTIYDYYNSCGYSYSCSQSCSEALKCVIGGSCSSCHFFDRGLHLQQYLLKRSIYILLYLGDKKLLRSSEAPRHGKLANYSLHTIIVYFRKQSAIQSLDNPWRKFVFVIQIHHPRLIN